MSNTAGPNPPQADAIAGTAVATREFQKLTRTLSYTLPLRLGEVRRAGRSMVALTARNRKRKG